MLVKFVFISKKGDFVVDKKDAYKSEFPIWRIENGKLLQKFEPFIDGRVLYHKSASIVSWSNNFLVHVDINFILKRLF